MRCRGSRQRPGSSHLLSELSPTNRSRFKNWPSPANRSRSPGTWHRSSGRTAWACHRPGEIGPFSLLTYRDAARRATFLYDVAAAGKMPPWKPHAGAGDFLDAARLSATEIEILRAGPTAVARRATRAPSVRRALQRAGNSASRTWFLPRLSRSPYRRLGQTSIVRFACPYRLTTM